MAPTAKQKCALGGYGGSRRKALKGEKNGCTADKNYRGAKGWGKKETAFAAVRTALSRADIADDSIRATLILSWPSRTG